MIHIIDKVLTVPMNLSSTALAADLRALVGAVTEADLATGLDGMTNITVFAPNDAAFAAIGSATGSLSKKQLTDILSYHVVPGVIGYSSGLKNDMSLKTAEGKEVKVRIDDDGVFVNGAKVVVPDVLIANGVVHVIDQ